MFRTILTFLLAASLLAGTAVRADSAQPAASPARDLNATIDFLLLKVASSDVAFIRNSKQYGPAKAAKHMQRKYDHFRNKIQTTEDFIRLTATRSLMSGKAYTVRFPDGTVMPAADWLKVLLSQYRNATAVEGNPETPGT